MPLSDTSCDLAWGVFLFLFPQIPSWIRPDYHILKHERFGCNQPRGDSKCGKIRKMDSLPKWLPPKKKKLPSRLFGNGKFVSSTEMVACNKLSAASGTIKSKSGTIRFLTPTSTIKSKRRWKPPFLRKWSPIRKESKFGKPWLRSWLFVTHNLHNFTSIFYLICVVY